MPPTGYTLEGEQEPRCRLRPAPVDAAPDSQPNWNAGLCLFTRVPVQGPPVCKAPVPWPSRQADTVLCRIFDITYDVNHHVGSSVHHNQTSHEWLLTMARKSDIRQSQDTGGSQSDPVPGADRLASMVEKRGKGAGTFEPNKVVRQTLNDQIYNQTKEAIISGNLKPGSILTIRDLASSFGVSMMPVREALSRLYAEHALVFLPNRSFAVPVLSVDRFDQVTEIRTLLEGLAVESAVPLFDNQAVDRLIRINNEMNKTGWKNRERYLYLNRQFHFQIYETCGKDFLIDMIESLWLQIGPLLNYIHESLVDEDSGYIDHHGDFLKAIETRDAKASAKAICDDILSAAVIIRKSIENSSASQAGKPMSGGISRS